MNKENGTSFYYRVAQTIRSRINSGQYPPDFIIPPSRMLAEEFCVSNITIQKAMDLLVQEGCITRQRGVGTRVSRTTNTLVVRRISAKTFWDWYEVYEARKELVLEVLDIVETVCPEFIRNILNFQAGQTTIVKARRIMKLDSGPLAYIINYFSPSLFKKSAYPKFAKKRFLKILMAEKNLSTIKIDQQIEATIADMDLASNLKIKFGDPLFLVEYIYRLTDGTPLAVTHTYHRGDRSVIKDTVVIDADSVK
jgi:GntR family transcriptional regulator